MATLIASSLGTSMSAATGRGYQQHLVYAVNAGKWLAFFFSSTNQLSVYYSADFATWTQATGSPYTLAHNHNSEGRNLSVAYKNIASNDVIHIRSIQFSASTAYSNHVRATFAGTTISFGAAVDQLSSSEADQAFQANVTLDANARPVVLSNFSGADPFGYRAANTDSGTSWTAGWDAGTDLFGSGLHDFNGGCLFDIGGGNVLALYEDSQGSSDPLSMKNVKSNKYTSTWGSAASVFASSLSAGVDPSDFGAVAQGTSKVHCVMRASSSVTNTFTHRIFATSGTTWANGAAIPSQTFKASTGNFTMASDGTNVWLFVLDADASNTIRYLKYNGSSWDAGWSALEPGGTQTRSYLTCCPSAAAGLVGLLWTQANGSNYDLYGTALATAAAGATAYPASLLMCT